MKKTLLLMGILLLSGCTQLLGGLTVKDVIEKQPNGTVTVIGELVYQWNTKTHSHDVYMTDSSGYKLTLLGDDLMINRINTIGVKGETTPIRVVGNYVRDPDTNKWVFWVSDIQKT